MSIKHGAEPVQWGFLVFLAVRESASVTETD